MTKYNAFEQLEQRIPVFYALEMAVHFSDGFCKKKILGTHRKQRFSSSRSRNGLASRSAKSRRRSAQSPSVFVFHAVSALYVAHCQWEKGMIEYV